MLLGERRSRILHDLRDGGVTVRDLAVRIGVSESTIRRDLSYLDGCGALLRTYGGAMPSTRPASSSGQPAPGASPGTDAGVHVGVELASLADDGRYEGRFDLDHDHDAKEAVAAAAAAMITDGQVVILDIGTTTALIARRLRGRRLTVITGNLAVVDELRDDPAVQVVVLGGVLRRNYRSLVGPLAEAGLRQMSADLAFLSCTGVRSSGHVVDNMAVEVPTKLSMINSADRVIVLAPAQKFPGTGAQRLCTLDEVGGLITTAGAPDEPLQRCRDAGGKVIIA